MEKTFITNKITRIFSFAQAYDADGECVTIFDLPADEQDRITKEVEDAIYEALQGVNAVILENSTIGVDFTGLTDVTLDTWSCHNGADEQLFILALETADHGVSVNLAFNPLYQALKIERMDGCNTLSISFPDIPKAE